MWAVLVPHADPGRAEVTSRCQKRSDSQSRLTNPEQSLGLGCQPRPCVKHVRAGTDRSLVANPASRAAETVKHELKGERDLPSRRSAETGV